MSRYELINGDCLDVMKTFEDNSVDSIVTDPPYGLKFMGKKWDYDVPSVDVWKECLRVLKPGGHLLAFGGTRTYHRLVVNIEDAGFEIRDQIQWIYGSGFPKALDISKAIDKEAGATREVLGISENIRPDSERGNGLAHGEYGKVWDITAPATEDAKRWSGWGTALKPANEPICLARKPLSEKTVANNVLKHGTGGLNVDATRVAYRDEADEKSSIPGSLKSNQKNSMFGIGEGHVHNTTGRFPANVIFDEDAAAVLDEQSGVLKSGALKAGHKQGKSAMNSGGGQITKDYGNDSGGASRFFKVVAEERNRFFYVAKASKKDRGEGNTHPTVKPIKLMEYLIRMITPPGGKVLDPFMGSGTTGVAAKALGFKFIGIEKDRKYLSISRRRMKDG